MLSEVLLWNLCFILLPSSSLYHVAAFEATPRWGQATVVVNDALYVYGGKTDEFNSFLYNSAPNNNDLLYLSLSSAFNASSPPWALVSSSANSTTQGPPLAWSILAAFNTSDVLLFGGQPGPNSPTVIVDAADSAVILDVFSRLSPNWIDPPPSWGGEPTRRIRHSAATSTLGFVFIFGGEKADGSNNAFSDHYVFNPNPPTFTLLPSDNGPPDLYGHVSIILPNGRIVVFGGYSQSQATLLPFSTIWVLDTTRSPPSWSVINTATTSLPSPRMAFAAVLIVGGKIIIHGGCDAHLQTNFADGWVLDTTQNPMTWTEIPALSQLGARRDHFAVASGNQVIFGFGYEDNGPAPAPLQIYDPSSSTFVPTYTPPPAASMTQTLPTPSQTNHNSPTGFPSTSGVQPTATNPNNPPGGGGGDSNDDGKNSSTTAIAVGTAFGVMGLILVSLGATYYVRRQHRNRVGERQFLALGGMDGDDGDESPHFDGQIPVVGMHELDESPVHGNGHRGFLSSLGIAGALGVGTKMRTVRNSQYQRRDMLADEDTRSFGEWYNSRAKDGRAGSSWSLRSILGGGRLRSRDGSTTSHGTGGFPTPWREKVDPFSDGAAATRDEETGFIGAAAGARPRNRREMSYTSYASSRSGVSYRDPFVDPIEEDLRDGFSPTELYVDHSDEGHEFSGPSVRHIAPTQLPAIRTVLPLSQQVGQTLSPLSEHTSQSTLALQTFSTSGSSQAHSSENVPSPFAGGSTSQATSLTSFSRSPSNPTTPGSPPLKSTSIIGASDPALLSTNQPMRRSNSWWTRFSRSSLLDRRSSDASRTRYDIRDPNPAPRLGAIEEASSGSAPGTAKSSPGSGGGKQRQTSVSRANSGRMYGGAATGHGKSMTSLRTADSEAIERMAGNMDVVQKERSRWGSGSTSSAGGLSVDTHASVLEDGEKEVVGGEHREDLMFFASPVEEPSVPLPSSPPSAYKATFVPVGPLHLEDPGPSSPGKVSERIQAYERRMSQGETSPPPTNSKQREERSKKRVEVGYGLVPRASLYVANPDHRLSSHSADS
ncbi:hypothetical protein GALMADRAFT_244433 [Galerina marginata CBS 339.88]|uniref:Galactose oxidase n=1 Tax=Galerina marginata (strain CBS 339.88) TaxID=685588 RepID=A0A067T6S7_GALM3|nr:hypothetical protein GALMADRAFT_244433 [Galerina marginata CBS 339.88]